MKGRFFALMIAKRSNTARHDSRERSVAIAIEEKSTIDWEEIEKC